MMKTTDLSPSDDRRLLTEVRAAFMRQGTSLSRWAQENNMSRQWVTDVLLGKKNGPAAQKLRRRIASEIAVSA